uniref:MCL1 apoptosis regulator, BCL2 family member b n=2 Tax=Fundulus heteroclitus TaxID=8078 RepID=A0A3Q2P7X9_FUNHE
MSKAPTSTQLVNCLISQNGVGDGQPHYRPGLQLPEVEMSSSSEDLRWDCSKRPKNLRVMARNGFAVKSIQENRDDGSLPSTPEMQADSEAAGCGSHAGQEALDSDTTELISGFLRDFTGLSGHRWYTKKSLSTMKRVVEDLLSKHRYAYTGMIRKLNLDQKSDDMGFVTSVAVSLFSDGTTNWGRIASLVAFGAVLCQHLKESGRSHCVDLVSREISTYLLTNQRDWLAKNNSWDGFVEFFKVEDTESTVRNTLMAFVGVAGIGAGLAFLIRNSIKISFIGQDCSWAFTSPPTFPGL